MDVEAFLLWAVYMLAWLGMMTAVIFVLAAVKVLVKMAARFVESCKENGIREALRSLKGSQRDEKVGGKR